jgi:serine/threonine-protein kinase
MLFAGFFLAHWTKLRLVDRERTLRVLRRALASGPGEIGPETGRLLAGVYAVGARLGRGGMGEVYEATDTRTRERVAVKMLHLHLASQARSLRRFSREAAILRDLGSPHIVRSIALEQDEGRPFIVLELLVGETLRQRVERTGPLSLAEVATVAQQLGAALQVAHSHGVVHRDLSPANVFLCAPEADFTLKVLDFGISKIDTATGMTQEGALLGTPAFMAPEQVEGRVDGVTPLTDVYAMGLVLFVTLTGRMPFDQGELPSVTTFRPGLNAEVDQVLRRATERDPAARFASAAELATALVRALGQDVASNHGGVITSQPGKKP